MVDSKSKKRLLAVTAVILGVIGYMIYSSSASSIAYHKTIGEISSDPSYIGKSVKVSGKVVKDSVVQEGNTCTFKIFDNDGQLTIVYTGQLPNQFGGDANVIVDGKLVSKDKIESTKMVAKCPSKYESKITE